MDTLNYSWTKRPLPTAIDGQVFEGFNFCRMVPHTEIFVGVKNLTFRRCNLVNCDIPGDAVVEDCLHIHKTFCSNLSPELIDHGLSACAENCDHVVDSDEIIIDGVSVDTIYHYEETVE